MGDFESVVLPELGFLARVTRAMSRSEADAEDLAQDTLLKAFAAFGRFDGTYPRAWLFRIARNTAINRDERRREIPSEELGDLHDDGTPEELVVGPVMDEHLQRALDDLPTVYRVVVDLVDVEGMRYQEAADLLEIPVGTVMSRLHRARKHLRRSLLERVRP